MSCSLVAGQGPELSITLCSLCVHCSLIDRHIMTAKYIFKIAANQNEGHLGESNILELPHLNHKFNVVVSTVAL